MSEYNTDKAVYTVQDLIIFNANDLLDITPKFQRREVWTTPARSYFIDTILRGMTVPPLYFRLTQNKSKTAVIREVVDGQQRVRSVLEFVAGRYRLAKNLKAPWAKKTFEQLTEDQQQQIMNFGLPTEIFKGISDQQILEVFCRLNMNGVGLNKQELRNGRYFGRFKQLSYDLALSYLEFWRNHRIFTEQGIARMLEVEITSELLIAGSQGMQDKKASIEDFYSEWDEDYPNQAQDEKRFGEVMDAISDAFPKDELRATSFRRPPLFYTLYCVVFHHLYGLPASQRASPRKKLTASAKESLRRAGGLLSDKLADDKDPDIDIPKKFKAFVVACQRQTDNIAPRKVRFDSLYDEAF